MGAYRGRSGVNGNGGLQGKKWGERDWGLTEEEAG